MPRLRTLIALLGLALSACAPPADVPARPSATTSEGASAEASTPASGASTPGATSGERLVLYRSVRRIAENAGAREVAWPDMGEIYVGSTEGGAPRLVARFPETYENGNEAANSVRGLAPDGRQMAVSTKLASGHLAIVVVDLATGALRKVTDDPTYDDVMPRWSPDGATIAFARRLVRRTTQGVDGGLWIVARDGSGPRRLLPDQPSFQVTYVHGWTPDSKRIAYGVAWEAVNYALLDVASGTTVGFAGAFAGADDWRARRPQFLGLFDEGAYVPDRHLDLADGPGAPQRVLLEARGAPCGAGDVVTSIGSVAWRPGRDEFLYARTTSRCTGPSQPPTLSDAESGIFVADLGGSPGRRVPTAASAGSGTWTPAGDRIVYLERRDQSAPVVAHVVGADGSGDRTLFTLAGVSAPGFATAGLALFP